MGSAKPVTDPEIERGHMNIAAMVGTFAEDRYHNRMNPGRTALSYPARLSPWQVLLAWLILAALGIGVLGLFQRAALLSNLERESSALHEEASQRANQHDAHLTALSAIAQAVEGRSPQSFLEVAATILRFYPRIDEVQLVPLDPAGTVIGTAPLEDNLGDAVRRAALSSTGEPALLAPASRPGHYLMVKRSPNNEAARDGLALAIDAAGLVASDATFWSQDGVALRLSMPGGETLFGPRELPVPAQFSRTLGSATQPLLLEAATRIEWTDLVPLQPALAVLAATGLLCLAGLAVLRQRALTQAAERRAELSGMEARLTHASRVNAMGEMASGMAHELTQPLTAILAQAQAGRRLLDRNDTKALADVLEDTATQARRASEILSRLRNWSRPQQQQALPVDLRISLGNVRALILPDAEGQGIQLDVLMPKEPVTALVDPVEIEQVMFNLLRNAVEAVAGAEGGGRVSAVLREEGGRAVLDVTDNGPGLSPDMQARLFTPFATTKPEGTGLGLALSQRLAERAGGEILYVAQASGASFRVVLPIAAEGARS